MTARHLLSVLLVPLALAACAENPVAVDQTPADDDEHGHATSELNVELSVTPDHIHILQSEATFTVKVTDHDGNAVTDFDSLRVERKAHDSDTWRAIELAVDGDVFTGTYTFASSGEYEVRVAGMRHGDAAMTVMHQMAEHLHAARAHGELAENRVEFESFPGHIHQGETGAMRFWVMEAEKNADGVRSPITGLTDLKIHCIESDGSEELHAVNEIEPGVYEAEHAFDEAGEFHAGIHMTHENETHEAAFELHIAHGH